MKVTATCRPRRRGGGLVVEETREFHGLLSEADEVIYGIVYSVMVDASEKLGMSKYNLTVKLRFDP